VSLPERHGERLWMASVRSTGRLLRAGAAGGAVHHLGRAMQARYPAQRAIWPLAVSTALLHDFRADAVRFIRDAPVEPAGP
jgi:hypothetical protein